VRPSDLSNVAGLCVSCVCVGCPSASRLSRLPYLSFAFQHHFKIKLLVEAQSQPAPPTGVFWFCAQTARTSSRHRQPRPTLRVRQSPGCEPGRAARSGRRNRGPLHAGAWRRAPWPRARATPMVSTPHHPSAKTGTGQSSRQRCRVMRPGEARDGEVVEKAALYELLRRGFEKAREHAASRFWIVLVRQHYRKSCLLRLLDLSVSAHVSALPCQLHLSGPASSQYRLDLLRQIIVRPGLFAQVQQHVGRSQFAGRIPAKPSPPHRFER